jgi:hypothetical protein
MTATFDTAVGRLSKLSVERHFDAYADVDWDDPELAVDPTDPRFELPALDPLSQTGWYRSQTPEVRAQIGCYRYACYMKVGWHFENLLQRGLLAYVMDLPHGAPEFRYAHHELIEESQHTLMFQEFINRTGQPVKGMPWSLVRLIEMAGPKVVRRSPIMFFISVLGGEEPIDTQQKRLIGADQPLHPLLDRIMRIHITEEARHLNFARQVITRDAPRLNRLQRRAVAFLAPLSLGILTKVMLRPPKDMIRRFHIPKHVIAEAYDTPEARQAYSDSVARTRRLLTEAGLMTRPSRRLWKAMGIAMSTGAAA